MSRRPQGGPPRARVIPLAALAGLVVLVLTASAMGLPSDPTPSAGELGGWARALDRPGVLSPDAPDPWDGMAPRGRDLGERFHGNGPLLGSPPPFAAAEPRPSPPAQARAAACDLASYAPKQGCHEWISTNPGPNASASTEKIWDAVLGPDGDRYYLAGYTEAEKPRYLVQAVDTEDGSVAWSTAGIGAGGETGGTVEALSITHHPTEPIVYATGQRVVPDALFEVQTVAYNAETGAVLWNASYRSNSVWDSGRAVTVGPEGETVYMAGTTGPTPYTVEPHLLLAAYDARTGATRWVSTYNNTHGSAILCGQCLEVGPEGENVYIAGEGTAPDWPGNPDEIVQRYQASDGKLQWSRMIGNLRVTKAEDLELGPDGSVVYLTGQERSHVRTVALDAGTGATLWSHNDSAPSYSGGVVSGQDVNHMTVGPDGSQVYLAGDTFRPPLQTDALVLALNASSGQKVWERTYDTPNHWDDVAVEPVVGPGGERLFVSGLTRSPGTTLLPAASMTFAFDAATGETAWRARYDHTVRGGEQFTPWIGTNGETDEVFVAGELVTASGSWDPLVIAYERDDPGLVDGLGARALAGGAVSDAHVAVG